MPPHVVHFSYPSLLEHQVDRLAVVLHIQPVTDLHPIPVHRKALLVQAVVDHQRDELLGELIRAVVVRAAGYGHRKLVRVCIRLHEQVGRCLACRVRAVRVQGGRLGEEALRTQGAVHLVGGDLLKLHPVAISVITCLPSRLGNVQQVQRAHHVRLDEHVRIGDGAVDMALRGEIHHIVYGVLFKQSLHGLCITDVGLHEYVPLIVHDRFQVLKVSCIG